MFRLICVGELELEPAHTKYTADTDSLVLEDETMRVKIY